MFVIKEGTQGGEGTTEEIQKSINGWLKGQGLTIRTKDEDESFMKAHTQKEIDTAFAKRNQQLEDKIKEITGVEKASPEEKYYDYFSRAMKEKTKDLEELQGKVKEYEEKGVEGSEMAKTYKAQLDAAQKALDKNTKELQGKIDKMEGEKAEADYNTNLQTAIDSLSLKEMDPSFRKDVIDSRISKIKNQYTRKTVDGVQMFYDKDGNPALSKQDGKPLGAEDLVKTTFADLIDESRKAQGAGSGGQGGGTKKKGEAGDGKDPAWKSLEVPGTVKSKVALTDWLSSKEGGNMDPSTHEFALASQDLGKELPLRG